MARTAKAKTVGSITVTREGGSYVLRLEDEAGKAVVYEATSDQALRLADALDDLLVAEEGELSPPPAAPSEEAQTDLDQTGVVKWYNGTKGFGFVTAASGEDAFLHRSFMQHAGYDELPEGARVRVSVVSGPKGPTVSAIARL